VADRPLDSSVVRRRARRQFAVGGTAISLAVVAYLGLPALIAPGIARDRIRTAVVDEGPVDASISASGTVVPEIEQVITSPVDARVLRVLERPGARLRSGQPIVTLDASQAQLTVDTLAQDLALKTNAQMQSRLSLQKSLIDLDSRTEVKKLQLASFEAQLRRDQELFKEGLLSEELLRKSELAAKQGAIELKQITAERDNAEQATRAQLAGLDLEITKLQKEAAEAHRQLTLASPRADRAGVLTWVVTEEGSTVAKGAPLARVADFSSFRVDATLSDVYARKIAVGQPAFVRINDDTLEGQVQSIDPTIANGVMTVRIGLAEPSSPSLRQNLRVDVGIVTARRPRALRIRRGPFATGEGTQDVFVVRGTRAVKMPVTFGVTGIDYFEITQGAMPGDELIVSDMRDYQHLKELRLR
jgi:HlyD family secretion protein